MLCRNDRYAYHIRKMTRVLFQILHISCCEVYATFICDAIDFYLTVNELYAAIAYHDIAFCGMSVPAFDAYVVHGFVEQLNAARNYVHLAISFGMRVID